MTAVDRAKRTFEVRGLTTGETKSCTWRDVQNGAKCRAVLLDFGLISRFDIDLRKALANLMLAAQEMNTDRMKEAFRLLGVDVDDDMDAMKNLAQRIFAKAPEVDRTKVTRGLTVRSREEKQKRKDQRGETIKLVVRVMPGEIVFFQRSIKMVVGLASMLGVSANTKGDMAPYAYRLLGEEPPEPDDCTIM